MSCALAIGSADNLSTLLGSGSSFVPATKTTINASLFDVFAEVSITTTFINRTDNTFNTTYILPLLDHVILYDVEILVDGEKRVQIDSNNLDDAKLLLERRIVHAGKHAFYTPVGEVPPGKEVSVKCTYAATLAIEGGAIQFILPSSITPTAAADDPLRLSLSMEAHNNVTGVTSSFSAASTTSTINDNKASVEVTLDSQNLTNDLVVSFQVQDATAPRSWTSVGTSGGIFTTRASVLVLQPPITSQPITDDNNEGETIFYIDVRNPEVEVLQQCFSNSFVKLPSWALFNVWACIDGANVPRPIFEQPVNADSQHFEQAIEKLKTIKPFASEEAVPGISNLLSTPITQPPRVLIFLTDSKGDQVDNMLRLASEKSVTTRTVVLFMHKEGPSSKYMSLLRANGGDVIGVNITNLVACLSDVVVRNVKPSQPLTVSWSPLHTHHVPRAPPPLFYNGCYLLYAISSNASDIKKSAVVSVQLGDQDTVAKPIVSSIIHRMACAALLNEVAMGTRSVLDQKEQSYFAKVLYSSWSTHDPKERPQLVGTVSEPSISINKSGSNLIAQMRSISGPLTRVNNGDKAASAAANFLMPSGKRFGPPSGGLPGGSLSLSDPNMTQKAMSIRDQRMSMMKSTKEMFELCQADYEERRRIPLAEAESYILGHVVSLVSSGSGPRSPLTQSQAQAIRSFVAPLLVDQYLAKFRINSTEPDTIPELDATKMKSNITNRFSEVWDYANTAVALSFEAHLAAEKGLRPHMEDYAIIIDSATELYGLEGPSCSFFGVFDGHSGKSTADFCKTNLPYNIFKDPSFNVVDPAVAITAGYLKTDEEFLSIAKKEKRKAGSTAVTLLLCNDNAVVSNAGDSEAVLCRNGVAVCLSTVHTPANESERQRVESSGGKVLNCMGTLRVGGTLAVTRSFGDLALKAQVIAEPSTRVEKLGSGDEFIVLATDGLYEVMKYQEVVDFIKAERAKEPPEGGSKEYTATKNLVAEAISRGSKDNVTALVIYLR